MKIEISWFESRREGITIPSRYGFSYTEFYRAYDIYYPIPINYIVRYWRDCRWKFLSACYWIGIIDVGINEMFTWDKFYRIKLIDRIHKLRDNSDV